MTSSKFLATSLNYRGVYPCPVCRVGKISNMPLMEAMYCDFCQEIFTVNLELQQIKMLSRQPPLLWHWTGSNWTQAQLESVDLGWGYGIAAIMFVLIPTFLISIGAFYFPPDPNIPLSWIPYIWTMLTFLLHLAIIIWLLIEVYQIPVTAYLRAITRRRDEIMR